MLPAPVLVDRGYNIGRAVKRIAPTATFWGLVGASGTVKKTIDKVTHQFRGSL